MSLDSAVFGFPEFLTAVALLILVFTAGDPRYRFRIEVAPLHLPLLSFIAIVGLGVATILADVWYAEGWPTLTGPVGQAGVQAGLGLVFLALLIVWIVFAYIRPPTFSPRTAKHFHSALLRRVLKGEAADMAMAADEMSESMSAIVKHCRPLRWRGEASASDEPIRSVEAHAHDILLVMGNSRFCRQLVRTSPTTAMALFDAMGAQEKHRLPVRALVQNLVREAIKNPDSLLYDEADEFSSDFVGQAKPFTTAVFGHYRTIEDLADIHASPLDLRMMALDLTARELEAYKAGALVFISAFLKSGANQSRALNDVFKCFKSATRDAYELTDAKGLYSGTDAYNRIAGVVRFVGDVIERLSEAEREPGGPAKPEPQRISFDIYDQVAELMFEIILNVAAVEGEAERTWIVHHNAVWGQFFGFADGGAWRLVRRRLVRRLYAEIADMERFANYKSARILGYCLNVLGLRDVGKNAAKREARGFHRLLLGWMAANFMTLNRDYPDVANALLVGGISFDEASVRLIKTYAKLTQPEPARTFLDLAPARPTPWDRFVGQHR